MFIVLLATIEGVHLPLKLSNLSPGRLVPVTMTELRTVAGEPRPTKVRVDAFIPDPLPPKLDRDAFAGRLHRQLVRAASALGRLDGLSRSLPNPMLLSSPLGLREARLSSQIENTFATAEEVSMLAAGKPALHGDQLEVWNYVRALEHGLASRLPISNRLILEMHKLLMEKVRGGEKTPGVFRDVHVYIGSGTSGPAKARFVPPPPGEVRGCMDKLERFINDTRHGFAQLIAVAMAHYQFECIHPFRDGNGRIGRLIAALTLCKGPEPLIERPLVYVSGYIDKHRREYYDLLLNVSAKGVWHEWVEYFVTAVASQAEDAILRTRSLLDLRDDFLARVTEPKSSPLLPKVIDHLFHRPGITPPMVAELLDIHVQAAQRHIDRLEQKEVITEATGGKYGRVWVARRLLALIESDDPNLEAAKPPK